MGTIAIDRYDKVVLVKLNRGVTNALSLESVNELAGFIKQVRSDSTVHGLVLASANHKFFSIGFDIPQLYGFSKDAFHSFYRLFSQTCLDLLTLPKPTIAALTGHAIAGGCILALCCDYRFIGQGRKLVGLNEVKLGVPVPHLADCCVRSLIGTREAREVLERGEFYESEEAAGLGLVDEVLPVGEVVEKAVEKCQQLGSLPAAAYGMIKRNRVAGIEAEVLAKWEEQERFFVECWYSKEARVRLREAMERF